MQSLNEPVDGTHSATAFRDLSNGTMKGLGDQRTVPTGVLRLARALQCVPVSTFLDFSCGGTAFAAAVITRAVDISVGLLSLLFIRGMTRLEALPELSLSFFRS